MGVTALAALTFSLAVRPVSAESAPVDRLKAGTQSAAETVARPNATLTNDAQSDVQAGKAKVAEEVAVTRVLKQVNVPVSLPEGPAPANDTCAGRIPIACAGTATGDNTTATTDVGDLFGSCYGNIADKAGNIFYSFTPTGTEAFLTTRTSVGVDSAWAIYAVDQGDPCNVALWTEVGCGEDTDATDFNSDICLSGLTIGDEYVISLTSWDIASAGSYTVDVSCATPGACGDGTIDACEECDDGNTTSGDGCSATCVVEVLPLSDDCASPEVLVDGLNLTNTTGATTDGNGHPGSGCEYQTDGGQLSNDVWFTYNATCTGNLKISTCNDGDPNTGDATYDTRLALYSAVGGDATCAGISCPPVDGDGTLVSCNDDGANCAGFSSILEATVTSGNCYLVRLGAFDGGQSGLATLAVTCTECGDGVCDAGEDFCSCPADCPGQTADEIGLCTDGLDNDCDGDTDCADADCVADPSCIILSACDPLLEDLTNCQLPPNTAGTVLALSDLIRDPDLTVAENFRPTASGDITEVCWWGAYVDFAAAPGCNGPEPFQADDFTITYYDDVAGLPGSIIAGPFNVGSVTRQFTQSPQGTTIGNFDTWSYTATHAAVSVAAGQCYWIEIANDTTAAASTCEWMWQAAGPGDGVSIQGTSPWSAADLSDYDLSLCLNGGVLPEPIGCAVSGACCDDAAGTCTDAVLSSDCTGRFQADTLCSAMDPPCGSSACCHPDGSCTNELPGNCVDQEHAGFCGTDVLCNATGDCSFVNGPGDPLGAAPSSQLDLTVPGGFFSEAADNFIFKSVAGDGSTSCSLDEIKYWGTQFNFTGYSCSNTGADCDPLDPAACGGPPATCANGGLDLCDDGTCSLTSVGCRLSGLACAGGVSDVCTPANPGCTRTPDDYDSIRVTIYNDAADAGVTKVADGLCGAQISTVSSAVDCTVDADCTLPGQICVDTDGDAVLDTCGITCDIIYTDVDPLATVVDLDIDLLIEHTWQGDLRVTLEHLNTGTTVELLDQVGSAQYGGASSLGYSADNFGDPVTGDELLLSDEAFVGINLYDGAAGAGQDNYAGPAFPGAVISDALSSFDGELKDGTWRITVTDTTPGDGGTLIKWSLHFNNVVPVPKGPQGMPFTPFIPEACTTDAECITAGCPTGTTCTGDAGTTCEVSGLPCGAFGEPDGSHTDGIVPVKHELMVNSWTWVPYEKPAGTVIDDAFEITMAFDGTTQIVEDKKNWLAIAPELAFQSGWYQTAWMESQNSDGNSAQQIFEILGTFPWQPIGADLAFEINAGGGAPCTTAADCADVDSNGVTDDVCVWWECVAGSCLSTTLAHPSDMGGAFGACPPDTFCNLADALHALTCFAGTNGCESINIDAGGAFGSCVPDGFCNLADALHALTCFAGTNTCVCGPSPESTGPNVIGAASLSAVASSRSIKAGAEVQVSVFINEPLDNLLGYQLQAAVSGGRNGALELVDITIDGRYDAAHAGAADPFEAFNVGTGAMLAGNFAGAVSTNAHAYLATFTYRASTDAVGTFVVDVLHGGTNQTMLVGAEQSDKIEVSGTSPAVIVVTSGSARSIR